MIIRLYNSDDILLSIGFRGMSPLMIDSIIIQNKLLDGTFHTQTIGDGQKYFTFEVLCDEVQAELVNSAYSTGEILRLEKDSMYYNGYLSTKPEWGRQTPRLPTKTSRWYIASIKFTVSEEGSI